jgi:hypothetical protein
MIIQEGCGSNKIFFTAELDHSTALLNSSTRMQGTVQTLPKTGKKRGVFESTLAQKVPIKE